MYSKHITHTNRKDSNHKKWLGRKGLQFLKVLTQTKQEICNKTECLFNTLNNKFKPQYNKTIKSLQFYKLGNQMKMQKNGCVDLY